MNESYNFQQGSGTDTAYGANTNPLPGSFDEQGQYGEMRRSSSAVYPAPRGFQVPSAYGQGTGAPVPMPYSTQLSGPAAVGHRNTLTSVGMQQSGSVANRRAIMQFIQDDPWTPMKSTATGPHMSQGFDPNAFRNPQPAISDLASDSAYVSQTGGPESMYSASIVFGASQSLIDPEEFNKLRTDDSRTVRSAERLSRSQKRRIVSSSRRNYVPEKCPYCDKVPKCPSELKKHLITHKKTFYCNWPGCDRKAAFGTINDLQRHRRTKHKVRGGGKVYLCAGRDCEKPDHVWPRLDNFKAHVVKVHKAEHNAESKLIEDIVRRSERKDPDAGEHQPPPIAQPASMDVELAGMDLQPPAPNLMNPQYPNTDFSRPTSGLGEDMLFGSADALDSAPSHQTEVSERIQNNWTNPLPLPYVSGHVGPAMPNRARLDSQGSGIDASIDAMLDGQQMASQEWNFGTADNQGLNERRQFADASRLNTSPEARPNKLVAVLEQLTGQLGQDGLLETLQQLSETHTAPIGKQDPRSASSMLSGPTATSTGNLRCKTCQKELPRSCDMKKHEKRHSRPYGCTFPRCNKTFGSKNDWKRHETGQHFQHEMWRCGMENTSNYQQPTVDGKCGAVFFDVKALKKHLKYGHGVREKRKRIDKCNEWWIGRGGHTRYWCGFCREIIPVAGSANGAPAWDQRFNHIDCEHFKNGRSIDDWLCIETKALKGDEEAQKAYGKSAPAAVETGDGQVDSSDEEDTPSPPHYPGWRSAVKAARGAAPVEDVASLENSRMQVLDDRRKLYCCQCQYGPYDTDVDPNCVANSQCGHEIGDCCVRWNDTL